MNEPNRDRSPGNTPDPVPLPARDARLLGQIRRGDADAGHEFVREYYPGVYRYLLYLTGRPEVAEDLTQETFLQAWRRLDTFKGRSPLRPWLHRIAHREFLQELRRRREESSLEEMGELPAPHATVWMENVELSDVLRKLPIEEREMMVLHYVEGYPINEIAQIMGAPVGRVKYRLLEARARLRGELGEGDISYLNPSLTEALRRWTWLPLEEMSAVEARLSRVEGPRLSGSAGTSAGTNAGQKAGAPEDSAGKESAIIDDRLSRKVTLAFKAMALSDLCERLRAETGIHLAAGASVADEKVTLFSRDTPLREVMRQLARPFGYTWARSGTAGAYKYELLQDLRSQLLEEELRNRDRNAAFITLEREIERYRPYLDLSPDEALARAKAAPPEERRLLEMLGRSGWGAIQMYFRLTPQQLAALRAGEALRFSQEPKPGQLPLAPDIGRGVLQSLRDVFFHRVADGFGISTGVREPEPDYLRPTAVPEARASIELSIRQTEPGRVGLKYVASAFSHSDLPRNSLGSTFEGDGALAVGASPTVERPDNRAANARLAGDPGLRRRVSVEPEGQCASIGVQVFGRSGAQEGQDPSPGPSPARRGEPDPSPARRGALAVAGAKATTADVLEAVHRATGLPVVGDFYTRLYDPASLTGKEQPLFDSLNRLADAMHLRWSKDGEWLQFRSASFYDDRIKEVPNRLLSRWSASRQQHGMLTLDDLTELAGLTDAQLDAVGMAEGARDCWGLAEWHLARHASLRPHLRFLAELSPAQRQEATSAAGLPFAKLSLSQQQRYIALALRFDDQPLQSLDELEGAIMRVIYTQPGSFEWLPPGPNWYRWVAPIVPGREGRRAIMPPVLGRTRDETLTAARRLDTRLLDAILPEAQRLRPEIRSAALVPDAGEIVPTELNLRVVYVSGLSSRRSIYVVGLDQDNYLGTW